MAEEKPYLERMRKLSEKYSMNLDKLRRDGYDRNGKQRRY